MVLLGLSSVSSFLTFRQIDIFRNHNFDKLTLRKKASSTPISRRFLNFFKDSFPIDRKSIREINLKSPKI